MKPLRMLLIGIPTVLLGACVLFAGAVFLGATAGNAPAQFLVGSTYQYGLHDFTAAAKWYRASAA
ncbi:MAG TPA: hypothetical protein VM659_06170 [Dongiaceae bacterium]|nr:hypothetical protein [Dongiaceae bacterium]